MEKEYTFKPLEIVHNPNFLERLVGGIINTLGYTIGYASLVNKLSLDGLKPTERAWKKQFTSYELDGEVIYRHANCENELIDSCKDVKTIPQLINEAVRENGTRNALGYRKIIEEYEELDLTSKKVMKKLRLSDYIWITYNELGENIKKWTHFFSSEGYNRERKLAIFAETSHEWIMIALSLMYVNSPFVTVYTTLTDDSIVHALNLTECNGVFVDNKTSDRILKYIERFPKIDTVIMSAKCNRSGKDEATTVSGRVKIVDFDDVLNKSTEESKEKLAKEIDPDEMALIMFTSGSTGTPKGVMISSTNILATVSAVMVYRELWANTVYPAYLPQAHILEFCSEIVMLFLGGAIGYGHPLTIITKGPLLAEGCPGDLDLLKPQVMAAVPLILERVRKTVLEKVGEQSRVFQMLFQTFYNVKAYFLGKGYDTPIIDRIVFRKMNRIFGGNLNYAFIGGALVQQETEEFFNVCFCKFKQAYGLTETCCGGTLSDVMYIRCGVCGPPIRCTELKLVPYEEGGYYPDDPNNPRGEVVLCGKQVCLGYFKEDQLTSSAFKLDRHGKRWFYTGDIAQMFEDGTLKIIDRKKDIIKLLHGEYVPLAKVESTIGQSKFVENICVMPNSTDEKLIALIIPSQLHIESITKQANVDKKLSYADSLKTELVNTIVKNELFVHIRQANLSKFEIPCEFHLLPDTWTPDTGLVTPSFKVKRQEIAKKYKQLLE